MGEGIAGAGEGASDFSPVPQDGARSGAGRANGTTGAWAIEQIKQQ